MRIAFPAAARVLADLWAGVAALATAAALAGLGVVAWAPPQDLPWTPLRLAQPVGLATGMKFEAAAGDPALCRAVLREAGVAFAEAPGRRDGRCLVRNAVRLGGGVTPLVPAGPVMTCGQALAYAFWIRHEVQPAARAHLGREVGRVDHLGTYACRNIAGRDRLSQHGLANALDVAGFRLRDGGAVTILRDFARDDPRGRFLRRSRDGACRWFRATLSPDYNAAHRDHLHLDRGGWARCS